MGCALISATPVLSQFPKVAGEEGIPKLYPYRYDHHLTEALEASFSAEEVSRQPSELEFVDDSADQLPQLRDKRAGIALFKLHLPPPADILAF